MPDSLRPVGRRPAPVRLALAAVAVAALCGVIACGGGEPVAPAGRLYDLVEHDLVEHDPVEHDPVGEERWSVADGERSTGLVLPGEPTLLEARLGEERRPTVALPPGTIRWRLRVPEGARLVAGVGQEVGHGQGRLDVRIEAVDDDQREVLAVGSREEGPGERRPGGPVGGWTDLGADLSHLAGRVVDLEITARRPSGGDAAVGWAPLAVTAPTPRPDAAERPNVLFVVIDTLRHDHLTSYGYGRDTAPRIDALLARRGVVLEDAYSQAPWTLPSAVSYLTSRQPGALLAGDPASFGIPAGTPVLPELFAEAGYATAGFIGNPTLHEGNGFGRGFETFHSPLTPTAMDRDARDLVDRALPWLRSRLDRPFFLYLHFIDPHDPYDPPDLVDGRSPWFEDPGGVSGRHVQGVYSGQIPVDDLDRVRDHWVALYDSEIRWVDAQLGRFLDSLPAAVLEDTLIVLTSDHGEEFLDHGGWKHGHTLYEDQIHVPLILRWDGRFPAGTRLPGTVRLLDLAPTLARAAGLEAPAAWEGVDLLEPLEAGRGLPRLAAWAEQQHLWPRRTAVVLDAAKLIAFNSRETFTPANPLQRHIQELDLERLEPVELYDLEADPGERANRLAEVDTATGRERAGPLPNLLSSHLDSSLRGMRALTEALPPGSVLSGELVFDRPPGSVEPLWLTGADRLELDGTTLRFEIVGGVVAKGFTLLADPQSSDGPVADASSSDTSSSDAGAVLPGLVSARLVLDGEPLPAGRLRLGPGLAWTGSPVAGAALRTESYPAPAAVPGLRLWRRADRAPRGTVDAETRERLEALGYLQ